MLGQPRARLNGLGGLNLSQIRAYNNTPTKARQILDNTEAKIGHNSDNSSNGSPKRD